MTSEPSTAPVLCAVHLPDWRAGNPYQSQLARALEKCGVTVKWGDIPKGLLPLNRSVKIFSGAQILHLHWSNELVGPITWNQGWLKRHLRLALLAADVLLLRIRGVRVIWTIHNLVSHDSVDCEAEIMARRVLGWACSGVIVHSTSALRCVKQTYKLALKQKGHVIPHGNYDGIYPPSAAREVELRQQCRLGEDTINILFFGLIREYKRVVPLVQAFRQAANPKLRLIIAGSARPHSLARDVAVAAAGDNRITLLAGFVPDADVSAYFAVANAVVIPLERSLTSGSIVLAMTMGKATILHEKGQIFDLVTHESGLFYRSDSDLVRIFDGLDNLKLDRLGREASKLIRCHGWDRVADQTISAYRDTQTGPQCDIPGRLL